MAFFILCIAIFIMFFQPAFVIPSLESLQPLRNSAIAALLAYFFTSDKANTKFFSSKINRFFIFFVFVQVISSAIIWTGAGIETFNYWLRIGIVYFLITKLATTEKRIRTLSLMIVLGILYLAYFSISTFVLNYQPGMRAKGFGWYDNANDIAIILVSVIPLVIMLADSSKSMLARYMYIGIAGIFVFNILFTGSRNGLIGLSATGLLSLIHFKSMARFLKIVMFVLLFSAVAVIGVRNVLNRSDLSGAVGGDESSEDRLVQWRVAMNMLADHPLLGIGPNEFTTYVADYGGIRGLQPHNTFIQVFAESGLLGGISFILFGTYPLYYAWQMIKKKNAKKFVSLGSSCYKFIAFSLTGFWICAFFSNRYQFYILYILIALLVAVKENILAKENKELL